MYIESPRDKEGVRDWEAEEDAQALLKAQQINADPVRKAKAQAVIRSIQATLKGALTGTPPVNTPSSRNNPATIEQLNIPSRNRR